MSHRGKATTWAGNTHSNKDSGQRATSFADLMKAGNTESDSPTPGRSGLNPAAFSRPEADSGERNGEAQPAQEATAFEVERRRMIAEAAYYKAEHRSFAGNDQEHDWYEAENEIDAHMSESGVRGN